MESRNIDFSFSYKIYFLQNRTTWRPNRDPFIVRFFRDLVFLIADTNLWLRIGILDLVKIAHFALLTSESGTDISVLNLEDLLILHNINQFTILDFGYFWQFLGYGSSTYLTWKFWYRSSNLA